jgi:hypothetical protein
MGKLYQCRFEVGTGTCNTDRFLLTGRFIIARRKTRPAAQTLGVGKLRHICTNLKDNGDCGLNPYHWRICVYILNFYKIHQNAPLAALYMGPLVSRFIGPARPTNQLKLLRPCCLRQTNMNTYPTLS